MEQPNYPNRTFSGINVQLTLRTAFNIPIWICKPKNHNSEKRQAYTVLYPASSRICRIFKYSKSGGLYPHIPASVTQFQIWKTPSKNLPLVPCIPSQLCTYHLLLFQRASMRCLLLLESGTEGTTQGDLAKAILYMLWLLPPDLFSRSISTRYFTVVTCDWIYKKGPYSLSKFLSSTDHNF